MGYYTYYDITAKDEVIEKLKEVSSYSFEESCKWYDCQKDIIKVSKMFPDEIISVSGEGEEALDLWHLKCKNGTLIKKAAIVTYPEITDTQLGG